MNKIEVNNIYKSFGDNQAVKDVSFSVGESEIFGLIGPDGAGKTTIFRMLTTLMLPDSGAAQVEGFDIVKDYRNIRAKVGYMPGKFSLYQDLTIEENLNFFATVFNTTLEANYDLIRDIYVQIEPFKKRRAGKLSGGMKQKLALCCALIHKPSVLFLDEPTTGVDVVSRKEFWEMLGKLKQSGLSILVSTPYMDEANRCDRIALIQKGEVLQIDKPRHIVDKFPKTLWAAKADNVYLLIKDLQADKRVESAYAFGEFMHFVLADGVDISALIPQLEKHSQMQYKQVQPSIEDAFIRLL
ncbi:MAG: ABC transporter ATP-binding protein [Mangrovibacterium sp.]